MSEQSRLRDEDFPDNAYLQLKDGEFHLDRLEKLAEANNRDVLLKSAADLVALIRFWPEFEKEFCRKSGVQLDGSHIWIMMDSNLPLITAHSFHRSATEAR